MKVLFVISTLTLAQTAYSLCFGALFETIDTKFQYQAEISDPVCNFSNTRATKLFMLGACSKEHQNNFGKLPHCPPGELNVLSTSSETCEDIFAHAFHKDIKQVLNGVVFDAGQICNSGYHGLIFVDTDCESLNASSVQLMQHPGGADYCWDGHTLPRWKLVAVVIGSTAAVVLIVGAPILWVCCCIRRRRRQRMRGECMIEAGESCKNTRAGSALESHDAAFLRKQTSLKSLQLSEQHNLDYAYDYSEDFLIEEDEQSLPRGVPISNFIPK